MCDLCEGDLTCANPCGDSTRITTATSSEIRLLRLLTLQRTSTLDKNDDDDDGDSD